MQCWALFAVFAQCDLCTWSYICLTLGQFDEWQFVYRWLFIWLMDKGLGSLMTSQPGAVIDFCCISCFPFTVLFPPHLPFISHVNPDSSYANQLSAHSCLLPPVPCCSISSFVFKSPFLNQISWICSLVYFVLLCLFSLASLTWAWNKDIILQLHSVYSLLHLDPPAVLHLILLVWIKRESKRSQLLLKSKF